MIDTFKRTRRNREMWDLPPLAKEELFQCRACLGWLPSAESRDHHEKSCRNLRFKCVTSDDTGCTKTFGYEREPLAHPDRIECPRLIHEGPDSISCYICRKSFNRRGNYRRHLTRPECKRLTNLYLWGLAYKSGKSSDSSKQPFVHS